MKKLIWLLIFLFLSVAAYSAPPPALNFSDIVDGPSTGLGDDKGSGAIVTIWGNNLGSSQGGNSMVTFTDSLSQARSAYIYYWKDADGTLPGGPADLYTSHKMQEIAFSIPDSALGDGEITVTVDGQVSNPLPFTVRDGEIFYMSSTGGSGGDGSFSNPWGAMSYAISGSVSNQASFVAGSIVYAKDDMTEGSAALIRYKSGSAGNYCALISYPGGRYNSIGGIVDNYPYDHPYWVISKTSIASDTNGISNGGAWRCIGNYITDITYANGQGGAISANGFTGLKGNPGIVRCLGNYVEEFGGPLTTSLHHVFYLSNRTHRTVKGSDGVSTYACIATHTASADNQPSTGANWQTYWIPSSIEYGSSYAAVWTAGTEYTDGKIHSYELGWNRVERCETRFALHIYDESECGDFYEPIEVHHNFVKNQAGSGVAVGTGYTTQDQPCITVPVNVYNNIIIGSGQSPFAGWGSVYFYGSEITSDVRFQNNTVYGDVSTGSSVANFVTVPDSSWQAISQFGGRWFCDNNIFHDTNDVSWDDPTNGNKAPESCVNNIFYNGGNGVPASPPSWATSPITSDPMFTDAANGDFSLQPGSPAIDIGSVLNSEFITDFYGIIRGGLWNIGAIDGAAEPSTAPVCTINEGSQTVYSASFTMTGTATATAGFGISGVTVNGSAATATGGTSFGDNVVNWTILLTLPPSTPTAYTATATDNQTTPETGDSTPVTLTYIPSGPSSGAGTCSGSFSGTMQ